MTYKINDLYGKVLSSLKYGIFVFVFLNSGRMCLVCEDWKILKICILICVLPEIAIFTLFMTYHNN